MNQNILITNSEHLFNQMIGEYYLNREYKVIFCFERTLEKKNYEDRLIQLGISSEKYMLVSINTNDLTSLEQSLNDIYNNLGPIDVLIHGNEMLDEVNLFKNNPIELNITIDKYFEKIYMLNRVITAKMIKTKKGKVIFPLIFDGLDYAGYSTSPILNNGKISLMKCMSHELSAFKLNINAMTFGYFDDNFDSATKKLLKKKLEIFALKPRLVPLKESIPALNILINPEVETIGGQNIHIGLGIETLL
ncbi:SDR family NAD(P)-dependent oxidoreductase [Priestia megaterium]|uniref:SDR family NAD(P)-dependent oxidoreductase n=1 Tax=Priestia megaterium TaxID=1404 RepID=UPI0030C915C0